MTTLQLIAGAALFSGVYAAWHLGKRAAARRVIDRRLDDIAALRK